jgi:hypothetical protein
MKSLKSFNDTAALKLFTFYGAALTIWLFALYSFLGAFVSNDTLNHMLYWSNAAQLIFCPLSLYAVNLLHTQQKVTHDGVKAIHKHLGIKK